MLSLPRKMFAIWSTALLVVREIGQVSEQDTNRVGCPFQSLETEKGSPSKV